MYPQLLQELPELPADPPMKFWGSLSLTLASVSSWAVSAELASPG